MAVKIFDVDKKCKCAKKGIKCGYELVSVNGNEINDVLDYRFYTEDRRLELVFSSPEGKHKRVVIRNNEGCDSLGLGFETYLMDKHRRCKNSCVFCFIDQLPRGLRDSLYFKDDDSRLSFLFGNYITLTNLTENDVQRIIKMHISPITASVHTMNPELRVKMMRNPFAGESLQYLRRFSDAGIRINAQLVLCPGINDGEELDFSLKMLSELEGVDSIAAVPVGLTKYREGLFEIDPYEKAGACDVIDRIDAFNKKLIESGRSALAYPSDEFFQLAEREMPDYSYYGDFPQLDNGVGLYTLLRTEFLDALNSTDKTSCRGQFAVATGKSAFPVLNELTDEFCEKFGDAKISLYCVENKFFGELITVAGLITGKDLIESLKTQGFSSPRLFIPSVMLKSREEPVFLDDISVHDVEEALNTKVVVTENDGYALFDAFCS